MDKPSLKSHLFSFLKAIALPSLGLTAVVFLDGRIRSGDLHILHLDQAVSVAYILLGVGLAYRLFCIVGLDLLLARATERQIPRILKNIIGIAAAILAIMLSVNVLFSGAFTGLIALSSVIGVVIGLALRPVILDVFSGLSANLDATFHIGDWIEISGRGGGSSYTGWVEEVNWRTTHLRTRAGNLVICPNSTLSTAVITNYSEPSRLSRHEIDVELPPEVDPDRSHRILLAAVQATLDLENGPSSAKPPDVLISEIEASGIHYRVRYWLDPSVQSNDHIADCISRSVLRHLHLAGIPLAEKVILHRDKRDILNPACCAQVLARISIFSGISQDDLERLALQTSEQIFSPKQILIHQGAEDHDMFILAEGAVDVVIEVDSKEVVVARMTAGDYFGEMALLTGERRTATIRGRTGGRVYRIGRSAIAPILSSNPALMELISRNLAERNLNRSSQIEASQNVNIEEQKCSLAMVLFSKMKRIFQTSR